MSIFSSYKKIFLLGFIIIILIAIPFSVYIAQQRQRATTKAFASTTLSFAPASSTVKVDDILTLNVVLDPGSGALANQVSFVKLSISFDSSKFTTVADSLKPNTASPNTLTSILQDPIFESGQASISLSIGPDPTRVVTTKTKIAILKLKALSTTDASNPSSITFDPHPNTQVLSIASSDQTSENVLSTTIPATITINAASDAQPSSGTTPTKTPTPSPAPSSPITTSASSPDQIAKTIGLDTAQTFTIELTPTITPQISEVLPIVPTLPPTGPGEKILGLGILGTILTLIGGALFILF